MSTVTAAPLDLRRRLQIVCGGATDHAADVVTAKVPGFDMGKTIFHNLSGLAFLVMKDKIANRFHWSDEAIMRITELYVKVPKPLPHEKPLLEFMCKDCNFAMEHADGSFMDHLQFCYEYSAANFKQHSPRVLLLHSIMGVGTNYFPMDVTKEPKLRELITESEHGHIEAFPSILRLILHQPLVDELMAYVPVDVTDQLDSITFYRVIDKKRVRMSAEDFWVQLNYQLIHLLDFLPISDWNVWSEDTMLCNSSRLHALLTRLGKLEAKVDLDLKPIISSEQVATMALPRASATLATYFRMYTPRGVQMNIQKKTVAKYSAAIDHDLSYELHWKTEGSPPQKDALANGQNTTFVCCRSRKAPKQP